MSIENLKQFGQLVAADESVREAVKAIGKTNVEGIMAYAAERGLPFDAEDLRALARESGLDQDELDEQQLESIAGGAITATGGVLIAAGVAAGSAVAGTAAAVAMIVTADDW